MPTPDNPIVPLAAARDQTIEELSLHFAHDHLTLEELERRLELAYRATNLTELRTLTSDLGSPTAPAPAPAVPAPFTPPVLSRLLSLMSDTKRRGAWVVPERLDVVSVMAATTLDFTEAILPGALVDVHLRAWWTDFKIIVPPGVYVMNRATGVMSNVDDGAAELAPPGAPVIRLTGWAVMSSVEVKVRRRELPLDPESERR